MENHTARQYIITKMHNVITGFLLQDGHPEEIRCYEEDSCIGNVYVGRVSNIVQNINAAFVDIAKGESCYLPLEDYHGDRQLKIGDLIPVQVVKDKIKTKQATVTTNISITGNYVIVQTNDTIGISSKVKSAEARTMLKDQFVSAIDKFQADRKCKNIQYGGIVRTKAENLETDLLINETIKTLCELDDVMYRSEYATAYTCLRQNKPTYVSDIEEWMACDSTVLTDLPEILEICGIYGIKQPVLYEDAMVSMSAKYRLERIIEKALSKRVYLKSGAYLVIEPTEALTVIDVNSGKAIKGRDAEEIQYQLNVEAAHEVARQLKLRNLSGIIIVDFISMKSEQKQKCLLDELKNAIYYDSVPTNVVDITKLGLVELTRKKIRKPLHEIYIKNC